MKTYVMAIGLCLVMALAACADDGVRLVDGMWVTPGVSDEDARRYAEEYRLQPVAIPRSELLWARRQRIWAQSLGLDTAVAQAPSEFTVKGWSYSDWLGWAKQQPQTGMLPMPAGMTPDDYNRLFWQRRLDEARQRYGIEEMDAASGGGMPGSGQRIFRPTPPSGPSIGGMSIWQYRDRMENQHRWETGQYQYPDWVQE